MGLLSEAGELNTGELAELPIDAELPCTVVCALSAHAVPQTKLVNQLFDAQLGEAPPARKGIACAFLPPDDSAALFEPGRQLVLLDVEQFDAPGAASRADDRARAAHLGLALSDVLLFAVRAHDLARPQAAGVTALQASLAEMLRVAPRNTKRLFVVVVTGYEADVLPRDELISGFMEVLQSVYQGTAKPPRAPGKLLDLFDFEFVTVPDGSEADGAVASLRRRLTDSACDDYFFERGQYGDRVTAEQLSKTADEAWAALCCEDDKDLPEQRELTAAFDCDAAMRRVFEEYERAVRAWRRDTEGGAVVDSFGEEAGKLKSEIVQLFDRDAAAHRRSRAFRRKRQELHTLIDDDLYVLYAKQVSTLRDGTYTAFKDALLDVTNGDSGLDRKVNIALRDGLRAFRTGTAALRPRSAPWRCDADVRQLTTKMKEDAEKRIQEARLSEYDQGTGRRRRRAPRPRSKRQPIALGIHYLNPAPFGFKDSRFEKLGMEDDIAYRPAPRNSDAIAALPPANGNGAQQQTISVPLMPERGERWNRYN